MSYRDRMGVAMRKLLEQVATTGGIEIIHEGLKDKKISQKTSYCVRYGRHGQDSKALTALRRSADIAVQAVGLILLENP